MDRLTEQPHQPPALLIIVVVRRRQPLSGRFPAAWLPPRRVAQKEGQ